MIRSSPNIWMIGSSVPNLLTRPVMLSSTPFIWSKVGLSMTLVSKRVIGPWASTRASFRPVRLGSSSDRISVRIWYLFKLIGITCRPSNSSSSSPNRRSCNVVTRSLMGTSSAKVNSNLVPVSAW